MCDQTEVQYLDDDVVWVKIGPIWWPGVVKDLEKDEEGKEILAGLKKKPIAVVKFFQEDNYEFVKNLEHIYHYSCRRKDEFIKKGLDKYRTGAPHMKKFPADVTTAESLTNGDVNIINDPKFYPEKKESYSEIFGSGKKKNKKDSESTPKNRVQSSAGVTPYRPITHQRFINKVLHGKSDHKVKTLIQCNSSSDDGSSRNPYRCHICRFETSRVNVIVAHHRLFHSPKTSVNWTGSDSKLIRKKPVYKSRKVKSKKLFDTSKDDISDEEIIEKKKTPKSKHLKEKANSSEKYSSDDTSTSPSKRKNKDDSLDSSDSKKPRFTDVLLADWNVDDEEDKKDTVEDSQESKTEEDKKETEEDKIETENAPTPVETAENSVSEPTKKNQSEKMSCFDFDEEEDGFIGMSNANTYGRKIPRVIPPKDKPELGMDLEIEELFKKKNEEGNQENTSDDVDMEESKIEAASESNKATESDKQKQPKEKPAAVSGKRRKSRASKDEDVKTNAEDSLALRRTRRPGARKSYLNEVIEKIDGQDDQSDSNDEVEQEKVETSAEEKPVKVETEKSKPTKEEGGSSSRRKQDFKQHTMDSSREEIIYSEIVSEQKSKTTGEQSDKKKSKTHNKNTRRRGSVDLTSQIDDLLKETKLPALPEISQSTNDKTEVLEKSDDSKSNSNNFSFDYVPSEQTGKKTAKTKAEVKSISRMFSDSIPSSEENSETPAESQNADVAEEVKESTETKSTTDGTQGKTANALNAKVSSPGTNGSQKRGSIVLSTVPKTSETSGQVKVLPVLRQASASKDCIVLPAGKKFDIKKIGEDVEENSAEVETASLPKNIKAIKLKSDSLPPSLITSGKLKGQTIIHQKGGKYVIVTQPPQTGRARATPGKVQSGSKVVILTNQLGEQKIITTGGLQQTKFKVEGQKLIATPDAISDKELSSASTSSGSVGQTQPVIKVVPDGKGGIMKKLTVSPKKVLLGGTKVLVSGSGSTFSSGNNIQKIALSSGTSVARASGGDFRLIENYKGSGKTVLIQGGSNATSGVVLKSTSVVPRHLTKVIQNPQNIAALKKKPKILMRAATGQGEYVMQSASGSIESTPTYVVKQKGSDGKFSAQKIVRTELVNQPKVSLSGTGTKTFLVSGQGSNTKGESYIITTNESVPGKVIRMRQKIKEGDISTSKITQKIIQKTPEVYTISQNSLLIPSQTPTESEIPIVQAQDQSQQPVLQTQVIAMPGPVGADGNQTYVLVSVDENGVVQGMDNSVVAYDASTQSNQIFANSSSSNNVILINQQPNEEVAPVFSTSSQDILAEALANTNVLEGSISNEIESVVPSILLPPSIPSSVVQETSITLQKPIMTPLEMPSSVTPDTSGLEPPPLPPTPTEEDVLMEDTEMSVDGVPNQEQISQNDKKEEDSTSTDPIQTYLQPRNFGDAQPSFQMNTFSKDEENSKIFEEHYADVEQKSEVSGDANGKEIDYYQTSELSENTNSGHEVFKEIPREDFIIENSQEEQSTNSFQSLPVLNDEPDTMEDAQASQPIADQNFDAEKARMDPEQFSRLLREQEPPSSTNNEILTESNHESSFETPNEKYQPYEIDNRENEPKNKDVEQETPEEQNASDGWQKDKESVTSESQSLPIIASESSTNTYDMDSMYSDAISQKRIQEETEVTSTTDEFSSKEIAN